MDVEDRNGIFNVTVEVFNADNSICPPVLYRLEHSISSINSKYIDSEGEKAHVFECETTEILVSPNSACSVTCQLKLNETASNVSVHSHLSFWFIFGCVHRSSSPSTSWVSHGCPSTVTLHPFRSRRSCPRLASPSLPSYHLIQTPIQLLSLLIRISSCRSLYTTSERCNVRDSIQSRFDLLSLLIP